MTQETNSRGLGNSLPKEEPQTKDIESGPEAQPKATNTTASLTKSVFSELLHTIREKRYHVESEKRVVYTKLMDHLDSVEETHRISAFTLISVEAVVYSALLMALVCSLTMDHIKDKRRLRLRIWQYITMTMMLASGLSVVRFSTFILSWPVMRWWRIHKYVVYFIRQLKRCVDVTLWFCIVLLGWYLWFRPRLRHVHGEVSVIVAHQVTRFLIALCIGSFLWLLKNILYLKLEADLHYDQLFERVRLSVAYLHGLQILYNRGMWRFLPDNKTKKKLMKIVKRKQHEFSDEILMKGENIWMLVLQMEKESAPIWILRRLAEEYLDQVKLRPLPGNSDITKDDQKILREAKKMFKQLISNRNKDANSESYSDLEIRKEDLKEYDLSEEELDWIFKPRNREEDDEEDETHAQASTITSSEVQTIGYDEFLNWTVRAYKNCWGLERTLHSSKRVFVKLNRLLSAFLLMVMLIIWLLLSEIVNTGQLALLFTPFLAASFIFGDSCRKMFEGLIFAFAMHPFDVGDRVIINNVQMRVTELNILTSVFHKYDTGEEVITPNSTLTTTSIINLDITPDQSDKVEFVIDAQTPLEDITDLEIKIKKLLDDDIEYSSNSKVVKSEIGKEEMKMTVYFKYLVSYLTAESKAVHKSKILSMIMKFRKDMEMKVKFNRKGGYSSSYITYIVEIDLVHNLKVKLKDIEDLEAEIMRNLEVRYTPHSKVVIVQLTKIQVKMGMYVHNEETKTSQREDESEFDDSIERKTLTWAKDTSREKLKKNLIHISETLKRNKVVKEVRIYQTKNIDKVIAHGGIGWGSIKANDVIQTQDGSAHQAQQAQTDHQAHPGPSLDTAPSGEEIEVKRGDRQ
ncbi:hypothetical protein V2J09_016942 [Rumex salicifolius]